MECILLFDLEATLLAPSPEFHRVPATGTNQRTEKDQTSDWSVSSLTSANQET